MNSFTIYKEYYELITLLDEIEQQELLLAIIKYMFEDIEPILNDKQIKIFNNLKRPLDIAKTNSKRRTKRKQNDNQNKTNQKPNVNQKETHQDVNVNVIVNDLEDKKKGGMGEKGEETFNDTVKASKHKYGKYKNVLLKDEELQALKEQYANYEELITYLDEYIEMKGYKAKSHYLCIKKWVIDAVKQNKRKQGFETEWLDKKVDKVTATHDEIKAMNELLGDFK